MSDILLPQPRTSDPEGQHMIRLALFCLLVVLPCAHFTLPLILDTSVPVLVKITIAVTTAITILFLAFLLWALRD